MLALIQNWLLHIVCASSSASFARTRQAVQVTLGKDEQVVWRATEVLMDKVLSLVSFKEYYLQGLTQCVPHCCFGSSTYCAYSLCATLK